MAVAATGEQGKLLENLRTLIANSAAFQTWVGAGNAEAAKASIYSPEGLSPAENRPFAEIELGEWSTQSVGSGSTDTFRPSRTLRLLLEADVSVAYQDDEWDAQMEFVNAVDGILVDMQSRAGTDGYLVIHTVRKTSGPLRSGEKDKDGDYFEVRYEIDL